MAPVTVEFSLSADAADANFMIALDGDDEETAMAMVNPEIMVKSNTTAVITPMWVEDAAGVAIMAVDTNMPFAYVDWQRLQADVVSAGATFMIQRTTVGANQEMEPTGDVSHVDLRTVPLHRRVWTLRTSRLTTPWRARCGSRPSSSTLD